MNSVNVNGDKTDMDTLGLEERTLSRRLSASATRYPNKVAVRAVGHAEMSYAVLDRESNRFAHGLAAFGVSAHEPLLVMLPDTIDFMVTWCGIAKHGAVQVPVNLAYRGRMLAHICNHSGARTMIVDHNHLEKLEAIADQLECLERLVVYGGSVGERPSAIPPKLAAQCSGFRFEDLFAANDSRYEAGPAFNDLIAIMYTSGTTGTSKGVMVTHAHAFRYAYNSSRLYIKGSETVVYSAGLPLFHIAGQWAISYACFLRGATLILRNGYKNDYFWKDVREHHCSATIMLGAIGNFLWQQAVASDDADNPLETIAMGPVMSEHQSFCERFGVCVTSGYGSTESPMPILLLPGDDFPTHQCVGRVQEGFQAKILDAADRELPRGEMGEICIRPDNPWDILLGYWRQPEVTTAAFRNLWYHTGDGGYQDESGRLYFVDRLTDSMRRRGENISSMEVEDEINQYPEVLECAVFPIGSEHGEQEVMATLITRGPEALDPHKLIQFLDGQMPYFMIPRYIDIVSELPRTMTGKVQKYVLRERGVSDATWDRIAAGVKLSR